MFLINEIVAFLAMNMVFTQALGIGEIISVAGNRKKLFVTSILITFFTTAGSAMTYFADSLIPEKYADFRLFCYVIVIGMLYVVIMKIAAEKFTEYKNCICISAFGCAVTGTLLTVSEKSSGLLEYLSAGLTSGCGFAVAALILAAAYRKLTSVKVPSVFRGFPAMLVYLGIISMAVYALE